MATLTQAAITTRKTVRYSIYFIIFLIAARIFFGIGKGIYERFFKQEPPPTHSFGTLPKITFPDQKDRPSLEYKIETATGDLPKLKSQTKVYFMPKISPNLLSLDATKEKAASLGFSKEPAQLSESLYKFQHPTVPSVLEIDIVTGVFSISYNLTADSTPLTSSPPVGDIATSRVKAFLSAANLLTADLSGPTKSDLLKREGQNLVPAVSLSEANLVRVSLFRKSFDELPSMTKDGKRANVWFTVSGSSDRGKQIIAGEYRYFQVDEEHLSTYAIKTASEALETLKNKGGYITDLGNNQDGKITIRKIYIAYYDPDVLTDFYQPIIVFEGDRGFIAYVPAVTDEYYSN